MSLPSSFDQLKHNIFLFFEVLKFVMISIIYLSCEFLDCTILKLIRPQFVFKALAFASNEQGMEEV